MAEIGIGWFSILYGDLWSLGFLVLGLVLGLVLTLEYFYFPMLARQSRVYGVVSDLSHHFKIMP